MSVDVEGQLVSASRSPDSATGSRTGAPVDGAARTRLYRDGALVLENFPVADISEHLSGGPSGRGAGGAEHRQPGAAVGCFADDAAPELDHP